MGGKVAVIIVNYNSGDFLEKCLTFLQRQTVSPAKTIVLDNGSSDYSIAALPDRYPEVEVTRLEKNVGFAAANNIGAKKAEDCDWIALLNPDAFAEPKWLENLMRAAEENPSYSFFGSHLVCFGQEDKLDGTGDIYHVSGLGWRRDHGSCASKVKRQSGEIFAPCAAAALYRKDVFFEAGGFDENYFCYFEDVDLGFRLRLLGHRCLHVPEAVVRHVGWGSTFERSDFSLYHGHRNLVWTFFKNMPTPMLWLYLPQHLLANLTALIWFSMQGQFKSIIKAKWDALAGLPKFLRKRKEVQQNLKIKSADLKKVMARGWLTPYLKKLGR